MFIPNNLTSPGARGPVGTVAQEETINKTATPIKTPINIDFIIKNLLNSLLLFDKGVKGTLLFIDFYWSSPFILKVLHPEFCLHLLNKRLRAQKSNIQVWP
jgi:hypothetical protein